jgi:hypothetical protein
MAAAGWNAAKATEYRRKTAELESGERELAADLITTAMLVAVLPGRPWQGRRRRQLRSAMGSTRFRSHGTSAQRPLRSFNCQNVRWLLFDAPRAQPYVAGQACSDADTPRVPSALRGAAKRATGLPGSGRGWRVAVQDLPVGAVGGGGAVRVNDQLPAPAVNADIMMELAQQDAVRY